MKTTSKEESYHPLKLYHLDQNMITSIDSLPADQQKQLAKKKNKNNSSMFLRPDGYKSTKKQKTKI